MVARLIVSVVLGFVVHSGMSAGLAEVMDFSPLIANLSSSAMLTVICLGIALIVPAIRRDPTPGFEELMKLMDNVNEWGRIGEYEHPTIKRTVAVSCDNSTYVCSDGVVDFYNNRGYDCVASKTTLQTSRSEQRQIRKKFKQLQAKLNDRDNRTVAGELQKRLNNSIKPVEYVSVGCGPKTSQSSEQTMYHSLVELYKEKHALLDGFNVSVQNKEDKAVVEAKLAILNNKIALQLAEIQKLKA